MRWIGRGQPDLRRRVARQEVPRERVPTPGIVPQHEVVSTHVPGIVLHRLWVCPAAIWTRHQELTKNSRFDVTVRAARLCRARALQ